MPQNESLVKGLDLPIVRLKPRVTRDISNREFQRIAASIRSVGLIEPLIVFPENGDYVILDGYQRYKILLEMGVERVPCLIWKEREAFTGNRMVNRLSHSQEMRMLRKSLEELDEKTIATAFGINSIHCFQGERRHPFSSQRDRTDRRRTRPNERARKWLNQSGQKHQSRIGLLLIPTTKLWSQNLLSRAARLLFVGSGAKLSFPCRSDSTGATAVR